MSRQISNSIVDYTLKQDQFILPLGRADWKEVSPNTPSALGNLQYNIMTVEQQKRIQDQIIAEVKTKQ